MTLRNPDLDKDRGKSLYSKTVDSHSKVWVVTTGFEKLSLAAMCQRSVEGQGMEAGRPGEAVGVPQ